MGSTVGKVVYCSPVCTVSLELRLALFFNFVQRAGQICGEEGASVESNRASSRSPCSPSTGITAFGRAGFREGGFKLAHYPASGGTWLPPEQVGVSRWIVPPVQLAPALPPVSLCLWPSPQCRACTLLCSGRSTIATPQSHSRLDGHVVVRSGQQRWCGASTFTTIWRGIALALSQHRRPGSTGYRSVWLLGVTSRACIVRCKGVQSLCALVCDFTDRHYISTPWTGQSAGVWAAGAWDRAGLFHTARLLGNRWHGPASESILQEAVRHASRPTEGQLQPYGCSCAGDVELFFVAWCNSKLARCSIGEGALRPLCDVCWRCGRWVPRRSLTSSPSFSFSLSSVSSSSFFLSLGMLFTSFVFFFFFFSIPPVSLPYLYL